MATPLQRRKLAAARSVSATDGRGASRVAKYMSHGGYRQPTAAAYKAATVKRGEGKKWEAAARKRGILPKLKVKKANAAAKGGAAGASAGVVYFTRRDRKKK